jgi:hypothetical protein
MTNDVTISFPHKTLTPLGAGRPNRQSLSLLHDEINANAISVPSTRGTGTLGHLALTVSAAKYTQASGNSTVFVPPTHPGSDPVHLDAATPSEITETNRRFRSDTTTFEQYCITAAALKAQLIAAVPDTYIHELRIPGLGYATVTALDILDHLDDEYGDVSKQDLNNNMILLNTPWNPIQPIEALFAQIDLCVDFAKHADPIGDTTLVRSVQTNVENTGLFHDDIRDWDKLPAAEQTLKAFKTTFKKADKKRRLRQPTATTAGYHQAAAATTAPPGKRPPANPLVAPSFYCWSHGLSRNATHTSATCANPYPGHCKTATLANRQGGCPNIQNMRNERTVWKRPEPATPSAPR